MQKLRMRSFRRFKPHSKIAKREIEALRRRGLLSSPPLRDGKSEFLLTRLWKSWATRRKNSSRGYRTFSRGWGGRMRLGAMLGFPSATGLRRLRNYKKRLRK